MEMKELYGIFKEKMNAVDFEHLSIDNFKVTNYKVTKSYKPAPKITLKYDVEFETDKCTLIKSFKAIFTEKNIGTLDKELTKLINQMHNQTRLKKKFNRKAFIESGMTRNGWGIYYVDQNV